ncbi:hypothetical protein AGR7C_pAt0121 [Agrobacterium deltaense Zutra 3/1]|uniref:Uncharacterized protein n=1 Tax=Agrobacterium deltaense Zutra 3/1 TaxID=1183427 RepID=A0A1S7S2V4_9HYPH|nr:hypothetical protein AGR7C_pAt0121 [Agrobacterium deltaense Zutra 3/1]
MLPIIQIRSPVNMSLSWAEFGVKNRLKGDAIAPSVV